MSVFYDQLQYSVYLKFSVNQMNEREKLKTELIKKEKKKKKKWASHNLLLDISWYKKDAKLIREIVVCEFIHLGLNCYSFRQIQWKPMTLCHQICTSGAASYSLFLVKVALYDS